MTGIRVGGTQMEPERRAHVMVSIFVGLLAFHLWLLYRMVAARNTLLVALLLVAIALFGWRIQHYARLGHGNRGNAPAEGARGGTPADPPHGARAGGAPGAPRLVDHGDARRRGARIRRRSPPRGRRVRRPARVLRLAVDAPPPGTVTIHSRTRCDLDRSVIRRMPRARSISSSARSLVTTWAPSASAAAITAPSPDASVSWTLYFAAKRNADLAVRSRIASRSSSRRTLEGTYTSGPPRRRSSSASRFTRNWNGSIRAFASRTTRGRATKAGCGPAYLDLCGFRRRWAIHGPSVSFV